MRSELSQHKLNAVSRRLKYIADADGKHAAKGLEAEIVFHGISSASSYKIEAIRVMNKPRLPGRPLKYPAWEFTVHPATEFDSDAAFANREEMRWLFDQIVTQMMSTAAVGGLHGLRDIHGLLLNEGPTGLGLKSYIPNRTNPRRYLAAVCDRLEKQMNLERAKKGLPLLHTIIEVRALRREKEGWNPLCDQLARKLDLSAAPSIQDLLEAFTSLGWRAWAAKKDIVVEFSPKRKPKTFDFHLLLRGIWRATERLRLNEIDLKYHKFLEDARRDNVAKQLEATKRKIVEAPERPAGRGPDMMM